MTSVNSRQNYTNVSSNTDASSTDEGAVVRKSSASISFNVTGSITGDGFERISSSRFTVFSNLYDPQAAGDFSLNPWAGDFAENMARKYSPDVFALWDGIASLMSANLQRFMDTFFAQASGSATTVVAEEPLVGDPNTAQNSATATTPTNVDDYTASYLTGEELFGTDSETGIAAPQADDVVQGELGDCYFLSTLAGVATEHPDTIRNNIKEVTDPETGRTSYKVRFYEDDGNGGARERWVEVDDTLLRDSDGNELYAKTNDTDDDGKYEMWAAVYEKAYAVFRSESGNVDDGYDVIGGPLATGGTGAEAYFAITGKPASLGDPRTMTDEELTAVLSRTNPSSGDAIMLGTLWSEDPYIADGLPSAHLYTVLECKPDPTTGEMMVTLRNPWGCVEPGVTYNTDGTITTGPGFDGTDDGIFRVPLSQVQEQFDLVTYPEDSQYDTEKLRMKARSVRA